MWGAKDVGLGQGHSAMAPLVRLVRRGAMCYLDFRRPNGKHHGAYNLAYALLFGTFLGEPDKGAVHLWDSLMSHVSCVSLRRFHARPAVSCASGGLMCVRRSHAVHYFPLFLHSQFGSEQGILFLFSFLSMSCKVYSFSCARNRTNSWMAGSMTTVGCLAR